MDRRDSNAPTAPLHRSTELYSVEEEEEEVMERLEHMEEQLEEWGEDRFEDYYQLITTRKMILYRVE